MNVNQTFSNREAVIQPYVMIILRGHPADERDYTTKVVPKVKATLTLLLLLLLLLLFCGFNVVVVFVYVGAVIDIAVFLAVCGLRYTLCKIAV
jgi:hypothetical protein